MELRRARERLVVEHLRGRGITDKRVLDAMLAVPRHRFVPESGRHQAYCDTALGIGSRQTISQPYIVALMLQLLNLSGTELVLDVGTGSGYQAALLATIVPHVVSIERLPNLACRAEMLLKDLGYSNVEVHTTDGWNGWPACAPYNAIVVAAAAPQQPGALLRQLAPGGRLVMPVGGEELQNLLLTVQDAEGHASTTNHGACSFVPLVMGEVEQE